MTQNDETRSRAKAAGGRNIDPDFQAQLLGFRLAAAEIIYHLPKAHRLLKSFN
ncbi:MAG: hypothetical protein KTR21_12800 [Rhodobacteraceae bacterium]|nr:hypothetical protein [Paracoccaceae bacterium]